MRQTFVGHGLKVCSPRLLKGVYGNVHLRFMVLSQYLVDAEYVGRILFSWLQRSCLLSASLIAESCRIKRRH